MIAISSACVTVLRNGLALLSRAVATTCDLFGVSSITIGPVKGTHRSASECFQLHRTTGAAFAVVRGASTTQQSLPVAFPDGDLTLFEEEATHVHPANFCLTMPGGRVIGDAGIVVAPDDKVIEDVSFTPRVPPNHGWWVCNKIKLPRCRTIDRTVVSVGTTYGTNYFHWITDSLPRLQIARESLAPSDLSSALYAVPSGPRFIDETLAELGIPQDALLPMSIHSHVRARTLVVPSPVGISGQIPPWVCRFLRESFLPATLPPPRRKLYVSRRGAGRRSIANDDEVTDLVREHGFECITLENMPFRQQVELFTQASVVVAPHGAGLTNLMWCQPGTRILEIFAPSYVRGCYWAMSNRLALRYAFMFGTEAAARAGQANDPLSRDIVMAIQDLDTSLRRLCSPAINAAR